MATLDQAFSRDAAIRIIEHFGLDAGLTPAEDGMRLQGRQLDIDQLRAKPDGSFEVASWPANTFVRETHTFALSDEDLDVLRDLTAGAINE